MPETRRVFRQHPADIASTARSRPSSRHFMKIFLPRQRAVCISAAASPSMTSSLDTAPIASSVGYLQVSPLASANAIVCANHRGDFFFVTGEQTSVAPDAAMHWRLNAARFDAVASPDEFGAAKTTSAGAKRRGHLFWVVAHQENSFFVYQFFSLPNYALHFHSGTQLKAHPALVGRQRSRIVLGPIDFYAERRAKNFYGRRSQPPCAILEARRG